MNNQSKGGLTYEASARMSDHDYVGVLFVLGDDRRLAVNPAGKRYALQTLAQADGGSRWVGVSFASLSNLLGKWGDKVVGLVDACGELPDDPALAAPDLRAARQSVLDAFAATDWRRDDYPLVLLEDGSLRLVLTPDGSEYRLQWLSLADQYSEIPSDNWRTVKSSDTALPVLNFLRDRAYDIQDGPFVPEGERIPVALEIQELLQRLPARASDCSKPEIPERPVTVW